MKLKASSSAQWVACPGSVKLQKEFPEPEGADHTSAEEGIAAHWVAERKLQDPRVLLAIVGTVAPNGVVITEEILEAVETYTKAVYAQRPTVSIHIEAKLDLPDLGNVSYPDLYYWVEPGQLDIWDFKYGRTPVEVFQNWQMLCYAIALNTRYHAKRIVFHLVQPRAFHPDGPVRTWEFSTDQLPAFRIAIRDAVALAGKAEPPTKAGIQCKNCTARVPCFTLQQGASFDIGNSRVNVLSPEGLAEALRFSAHQKKLVDAWDSGLKAHAEAIIKAGTSVPGFDLTPTRGTVKWEKSVTEVEALGAMFGKTLTTKKPITPGQAKKLGIPEKLVDALSKKYTGLALTPVNMAKVADKFKQ